MPLDEILLLEYSPSQGAFHVAELHETCRANLQALVTGNATDYLPVAASCDREVLDKIAKKLKNRLRDE